MENILLSTEIEQYVEAIRPYSIKEIGSKQWLDWHYRLQKLNQQMIMDISCLKEETVKETMISMRKVISVIHEAIVTSIWKYKILPLLFKYDSKHNCTFLLYSVLYHEAASVALLESILYHPASCEALEDAAVDLIDYACSNITQLFVIKCTDSSEEINEQKDNLQFDIAIRCLSIIRYLAENMDQMELSANVRLYSTHDAPVLFAQLIVAAPWIKENKVYTEGRWKQLTSKIIKISQAETQAWLTVRSLLLNPLCLQYYTFTSTAKNAFVKLIGLMNDNLLDQICPLIELKQYLMRLTVGGENDSASAGMKKSIILEVIPQMRENILKECKGKWKEIAKLHAQRLLLDNQEDIKKIATELSDAYNVDVIEKLENLCTKEVHGNSCESCGKLAEQKCSRCKQTWYCSRNCQVSDWQEHKNTCQTI